jgi:hypothetical protein
MSARTLKKIEHSFVAHQLKSTLRRKWYKSISAFGANGTAGV